MQVTSETSHHFANIRDAKTFALAGNATLTLQSLKSGQHFTFKIREKSEEGRDTVHFVNLLSGPNNESDFRYMGIIREGRFCLTRASKVSIEAASWKAFNYFWNFDHGDLIPAQLIIRHCGRCGKCGRTLTVPESIDRGIGPDCAELMGLSL
jgi:uncharacterized protein DUF6011